MKIKIILKLLRVKQWTKNLLLFAGILFTGNIFNFPVLKKSFLAFFLFSILSSGVYIFNDILDLKEDKLHPLKSKRPIASGEISIFFALVLSLLLITSSLIFSFFLHHNFFLVSISYLLLNIIYTIFLKHQIILDVFSISTGFILRAVAGAVVIDVKISPWLLICTGLLSLFIASGKRRQELLSLGENASYHRPILKFYSEKFLDKMISVATSSTIIAYSFYTFTSETALKTHNLMLTIPFALYGILRYLYLIYKEEKVDEPENIIFSDIPLLLSIFFWGISCIIILQTGGKNE